MGYDYPGIPYFCFFKTRIVCGIGEITQTSIETREFRSSTLMQRESLAPCAGTAPVLVGRRRGVGFWGLLTTQPTQSISPGSVRDPILKKKKVEINRRRHHMLPSAICMQACATPHPHMHP